MNRFLFDSIYIAQKSTIFSILLLGILSGFQFSCDSNSTEVESEEPTTGQFQEQHRPQFHFTPPQQWMNDPNGMVYLDGEYHLFYQHYPDSNVWGPMHWGHAISTDLVHWEHLPIALYPDSLGLIFSGSAVFDANNTSGLGTADNPPLVALFTHHLMEGEQAGRTDYQYQSLAYSTDRGRSWTKYTANPVLPNPGIKDWRDPKVVWDADSKQWVMALAAFDEVQFYGSPNLIDWTFLSSFGNGMGSHGGVWECPDLFPIKIEGTDQQWWCLIVSVQAGSPNGGSGAQYFIGDFDGTQFRLHPTQSPQDTLWVDFGRDNYAGVTWSNVPESDGRRLFLGWMSNWQYATVVPTYDWRSAMTIARELKLQETQAGPRLGIRPVRELEGLRQEEGILAAQTLEGIRVLEAGIEPAQAELQLSFDLSATTAQRFGLLLTNTRGDTLRIGFDQVQNAFFTDRQRAGKTDFQEDFATGIHLGKRFENSDQLAMHIYLDRSSLELFSADGQTVMTDIFFPQEDFTTIALYAEAGTASLREGFWWNLESIWN